MAKSDTAKVIWIIGGILAVGVASAVFIPMIVNKLKGSGDESETDSDKGGDDGVFVPNVVPVVEEIKPTDTPEQVLMKSYNKARKALGLSAKVYTTHTSLTTDKNVTGGGFAQGTKFRIKIWPSGVFATFYQPKSSNDWTFINKGRYYKGGDRLVVGLGRNKGVVIDEGKPLLLNITKSIKS